MASFPKTGTGGEFLAASGDGSKSSPFVEMVSVGDVRDVLDLTLSLDTNIYADGDVLADTQSLASFFRVAGGVTLLESVHVLDEDDQGIAFDLIFLNASTSLGTENSAPNISDANARNIIGRVPVATGDYTDIGTSRVATVGALNRVLKAASDSTTIYVAAISRGTGTYTAAGIRLKFGIKQS